MPFADVTGFVLVGGKSSRMGEDKALLSFEGSLFLEVALKRVRDICAKAYLVGSRERYGRFGEVVEDRFKDCGPLGGIHAALTASTDDLNLVVAVDTPLLQSRVLEYLIGRARQSSALVTVSRSGDRLQPLGAVYRRKFAELAEGALKAGRGKIEALFSPAIIEAVEETELQDSGLDTGTFLNVNTQADMRELLRRFKR